MFLAGHPKVRSGDPSVIREDRRSLYFMGTYSIHRPSRAAARTI
jgi:hypothetical protein